MGFLEKGLGIVAPPNFVYDFSRRMFLMVYSINSLNFTVWLLSVLKILSNVYIAIVFFPGCDVINFENDKSFDGEKSFQLTKIVSDQRVRL